MHLEAVIWMDFDTQSRDVIHEKVPLLAQNYGKIYFLLV